ncbi:MAG: sigma-70 family RNA polymerase sigma factor [Thermomicrobiales bacterium]
MLTALPRTETRADMPIAGIHAGTPAPNVTERREPDDLTLITAIAAGDSAALDQLYVRYRPAALAAAYSVLRDAATAEDILHETFLSVWRSAASYRPERGSLRSWLMTITRNAAIDYLRARKLLVQPTLDLDLYERREHVTEDVPATVEATIAATRLHRAVQALPAAQRDAVELAFFSGLTHGEIAARTGLPLGTVKGRLRLGMRRLRHDLQDLAPESVPVWH